MAYVGTYFMRVFVGNVPVAIFSMNLHCKLLICIVFAVEILEQFGVILLFFAGFGVPVEKTLTIASLVDVQAIPAYLRKPYGSSILKCGRFVLSGQGE